MAYLHPHSVPCSKSEVNLFTVPATQVAIEKGKWIAHHPKSIISESSPIEFGVSGTDDYCDLSKSFLLTTCQIVKQDGSNIDTAEKVAPVNYLHGSLFKQVDVFFNGTQVTQATGMYAHKSYFETILNHGSDAKKSQYTAGLFYKDTAGKMDSADPTLTAAPNAGLVARYKHTKSSNTFELAGPIFCDVFYSDRLLLNYVDVDVKLTPNSNAFCLMSSEANPAYKIVIKKAVLMLYITKVSPVIKLEHTKMLEKGITAKYPFRRTEIKSYTVPSGNPSIHKSNVFSGAVPKHLVIAMTESTAFNGSYGKNPFNFQLFKATSFNVTVDGEQIPQRPIEMKFPTTGGKTYLEGFLTLFSGNGMLFQNTGLDVDRSDWISGYSIFVFDLSQDHSSSADHLNEKLRGDVSIDIQFSEGLSAAINLIVYGSFDALLEIDKGRHITLDNGN